MIEIGQRHNFCETDKFIEILKRVCQISVTDSVQRFIYQSYGVSKCYAAVKSGRPSSEVRTDATSGRHDLVTTEEEEEEETPRTLIKFQKDKVNPDLIDYAQFMSDMMAVPPMMKEKISLRI